MGPWSISGPHVGTVLTGVPSTSTLVRSCPVVGVIVKDWVVPAGTLAVPAGEIDPPPWEVACIRMRELSAKVAAMVWLAVTFVKV